MRRFFSRDDFSELESGLRESRAEPRSEFLDDLVSRVERVPLRVPARRSRFAAALVFSVVVLVGLAAFGGVGYAKSSITSAVKSSGHAVSAVVNKGNGTSTTSSNNQNNIRSSTNDDNNDQGSDESNNRHGDDPPSTHQYSHFVLVCYPFTIRRNHRNVVVFRTIVVQQRNVSRFVPPGTLGSCSHR